MPRWTTNRVGDQLLRFSDFAAPFAALVACQQILVGVDQVAVGREHVAIHPPTRFGPHAGDVVAARFDFFDRIASRSVPPSRSKWVTMAATSVLVPPLANQTPPSFFHRVDQRVDRAGRHRIAADQKRMKGQCLAQLFVLHIRRDDRIDRAPCLIFHQRRRRLDHRCEVEKGNRAELLIAFLVHALRIFEELAIAFDIVGIQFLDLGLQPRASFE